ncbi:general substrate transporter [Plectosphaerella plurivora]|uniref:General substrate transporter n=1 Tax=Plectosphaerella plurivora TaxID=936078 RepID=A0A9P8V1S7_9PEZI|nr:general substrate transporter [Plectosphaerella plurivora]
MLGLGHLDLGGTFNKTLTLTVLLIAFSQFNFGFDQQGYSATQAMDSFIRQFGTINPKTGKHHLDPVWLSFFNGFNYLGQGAGVVIGSWISNRFGRRMCMFTMSIWAMVCATIVLTARSRDQILIGRVFNYIYIGMELAVVPVFQSEIAPEKSRGFVVGTYQISLFSPRWLILKDRGDEAMTALRRFREGKYTEEEIQHEYRTIHDAVHKTVRQGSFVDIFRGTNLKRTYIVAGANFFLQATGQIFTSIYGAIYVKSLGTVNPFNITITIAVVNVCTSLLAMVLTDKLGRRTQVFVGASVQTAALMTMGGIGTATVLTHSLKSGIIAMMVVFTFGYSLGWAPTSHILSPEIPNTKARDMTYRTASVLNIAVQFAVSFSLPYLLYEPYAALGSRVGFIFGSIAAISLVFAYFSVPDCSGRTLEEIDQLFEAHIPPRHFRGTKLDESSVDENVKALEVSP